MNTQRVIEQARRILAPTAPAQGLWAPLETLLEMATRAAQMEAINSGSEQLTKLLQAQFSVGVAGGVGSLAAALTASEPMFLRTPFVRVVDSNNAEYSWTNNPTTLSAGTVYSLPLYTVVGNQIFISPATTTTLTITAYKLFSPSNCPEEFAPIVVGKLVEMMKK